MTALGLVARFIHLSASILIVGSAAMILLAGRSDRPTALAWESRVVALTRALVWLPYCALFATLFFPPQTEDLGGLARFAGVVAATAFITGLAGALLSRRGAERARGLYSRVVPPYSVLVLLVIVGTLIISH